ncbi:hypothetical protein ORV05_08780 [Amycolatopsis cynarae]|uniref:Uncharacterized protein n=1 Tax=Amycolatopsis cynarae TaxID=2995223 RepID=A0ABY7B698_9PSEU|nr:hypothetical protein [Amycolatopsis sp. HUAS 11-8]WAL67849.1 hypothetical protein ORV05_08780 [Amycolatopsis sp. HUAS 11-8]
MTDPIYDADGLIAMYPAETNLQMAKLRGVGDDLKTAWQNAKNEITAEGKIGSGPLGEKFMAQYKPGEKSFFEVMDGTPGKLAITGAYQDYADAGESAVRKYEGTDDEVAGSLGG